jgi:ActR/RegA family two-component response regulator
MTMSSPFVAIVDDDPAFAAYLRTFLSLRGYETRCCSRGDEMLAAIRQGDPPDVVLLDLMPRAALAWDALLSLLCFVQHSGMVRRPFPARLKGCSRPGMMAPSTR